MDVLRDLPRPRVDPVPYPVDEVLRHVALLVFGVYDGPQPSATRAKRVVDVTRLGPFARSNAELREELLSLVQTLPPRVHADIVVRHVVHEHAGWRPHAPGLREGR